MLHRNDNGTVQLQGRQSKNLVMILTSLVVILLLLNFFTRNHLCEKHKNLMSSLMFPKSVYKIWSIESYSCCLSEYVRYRPSLLSFFLRFYLKFYFLSFSHFSITYVWIYVHGLYTSIQQRYNSIPKEMHSYICCQKKSSKLLQLAPNSTTLPH